VPLYTLPRHLPQAVVAVADARFYQHPGFAARAVLPAAWVNQGKRRTVEGPNTSSR